MATTRTFAFLVFTLFHAINFHITDAAVCWIETKDVHGFGGTPHKTVTTRVECQRTCVRISACVAIDWEPRSPYGEYCWTLTTTPTDVTTENGTITHYELNRNCQSTITTHLPTPTRSSTMPVSTVSPSTTTGVSASSTPGHTTTTGSTTTSNASMAARYQYRTDGEDVLAIRPAYAVIAGLGAGNLLLVVIAIVVICSYPLNRTDSHKNGGVDDVGGGGGGVDSYPMDHTQRDYEGGYLEPDVDHHEQQPPPPQQQWGTGYSDENEANDKRYTSSSYDDQPPAVEENPYFNKDEIEASASF